MDTSLNQNTMKQLANSFRISRMKDLTQESLRTGTMENQIDTYTLHMSSHYLFRKTMMFILTFCSNHRRESFGSLFFWEQIKELPSYYK